MTKGVQPWSGRAPSVPSVRYARAARVEGRDGPAWLGIQRVSAIPQTPEIVTRFPPSPTGFLHIDAARTALFNWLYERHHGARFLLRIEDTDKARSTQAEIDALLDGMRWL